MTMSEREMQINSVCSLIIQLLKESNLTLTVDNVKDVNVPILIDNLTNKKYVFIRNENNKRSDEDD